jgi:site-specific recombinase XerD
MTLDQAIDEFLEYLEVERNFSPLTVQVYQHYLRRLSDWVTEQLPRPEPEDLDQELVRKYRLFLARLTSPDGRRLKKVTQTYHLIALRSLLRYLTAQRGIATLSPDRIELPRSPSRTITFLSPDEVDRLLSSPDTSNVIGLRDKAILETLFSTGLRVAELARLNRDQMDLERRELGVIGKGNKPRVVFLSDAAAKWIGLYLRSREDYFKPLFIRYAGRRESTRGGERMRLTPRSIQRVVAKYARICHLPVRATPHTLRHSFATDLLIGGADIRSVQEMLGHTSITTTQVYTHVTDRHLKQVHRAYHSRNKDARRD